MKELTFKTFKGVIDPNDAYTDHSAEEVIAACGFIPGWVAQYFTALAQSKQNGDELDMSIKEFVSFCYGFPVFRSDDTVITENLIHQYPGDPNLNPYLYMTTKEEGGPIMVQYPHAMVAFRQSPDDEWYCTRMD